MTYAVPIEQLLDSVRIDPAAVVETAAEPSTHGLPDGIADDLRLAAIAGG